LSQVTGQVIQPRTNRRALSRAGLKAVVKKKKPYLRPAHMKGRREFVQHHLHWTVDHWMSIIFSDETKINRLGSDGQEWAWKRPGESLSPRLVKPTLKFGGGHVMIWGCMTWQGVGYACKIDGNLNRELYEQILEDELLQTLDYYGLQVDQIIFHEDNDPKHTCKRAKEWFQKKDMEVYVWLAQSPDFNPIEHFWEFVKKKPISTQSHPREFWSCGRGSRWNGRRFQGRLVRSL
jgi:hypothetical protein